MAVLHLSHCLAGGAILISLLTLPLRAQDPSALAQEESRDYFEKWLKEDVVYIISAEEKAIFRKLTTPEEKEQFIEQFWFRRDPDPSTTENEAKEEHYRRIAYANEHFASGIRGWQTDRGRIYIIHGPPDEIQSHPSAGPYTRPTTEGGGRTYAFPFETWRYRYLPEFGNDVVIEFVDRTQSGEYRLAMTPDEKDALLHVPGYGLTLAEDLGMARKEDRLIFSPEKRWEYRGPFASYYTDPFERYERLVNLRQAQPIRYDDLKSIVQVNVTYDSLPFRLRKDYLKLNDAQVIVPLTIEIDNHLLSFQEQPDGGVAAKVAIYAAVSNMANRLVQEFDDDLAVSFPTTERAVHRKARSIYQKTLVLDRKSRYKLTLVVKDSVSGKVGTRIESIDPPAFQDNLWASSLILSNSIRQLEEMPEEEEMFVLGDFYVRPSLTREFESSRPLNLYFQLYNPGVDQATQDPSVALSYSIKKDGKVVADYPDPEGRTVQYFSSRRIVIAAGFPLARLAVGKYSIEVSVRDLVSDRSLTLQEQFSVVVAAAETGGSF